jgi:hypothetical protein
MPAEDNFEELEDLDDDELLVELGKQLSGEGLGFSPEDFSRLKNMAQEWLRDHLGEIRRATCGKQFVHSIKSEGGSALLDMVTVVDSLAALYGRATAGVAAVILVRRGLDTLCRDS